MKPNSKTVGESGFIQLIIIIIIALLVLHYLNISLSDILGNKSVGDFASYVVSQFKIVWQDFLLLINFAKDIIAKGNGTK